MARVMIKNIELTEVIKVMRQSVHSYEMWVCMLVLTATS